MPILAAYVVPHPPLIVPEVGRGQQARIRRTTQSYEAVAAQIGALAPDTVILITPHATLYADYIHISPGERAEGMLARYGASRKYAAEYDVDLVREIERVCEREGFPAGTKGREDKALDHATIVPLHFLADPSAGFRIVRVSASGLSRMQHYRFGMLLREAVEAAGKRAVVVASGDLSHKLSKDGPYGYAEDGAKHDAAICDILRTGDFAGLFHIDESLCENAAECGFAGMTMLAGALDGWQVEAELLSYEAPFGVGYAVARFAPVRRDEARAFLERAREREALHAQLMRASEDEYVRLARRTLEYYIRDGELPAPPEALCEELRTRRAGVFVSIKKHGRLRGCIGTTEPTQHNLALEIMQNTISAGMFDPRFSAVRADELDELVYSVDVLSPAEPIEDRALLDVSRYGVIVSLERRRGLLLPDLEGVDSVEAQLSIACQKAGIAEDEPYRMERFEVERHT